MLALKMNYKDDDFQGSRKYKQEVDEQGNSSFEDVTAYTKKGDDFGAPDINQTNAAIMGFVASTTTFSDDMRTITERDAYGNTLLTEISADMDTVTQRLTDPEGNVLGTHTASGLSGKTITEEANIL